MNFNSIFLHRSNKYGVPLPAMLLARPREGRIESVPLASIPVQDMAQILANAPLEAFVSISYRIRKLFEVKSTLMNGNILAYMFQLLEALGCHILWVNTVWFDFAVH